MKYRCSDCGYLVSAYAKEFPCMRCGGRKYENTGLYDQSCESNPHILSLQAELAKTKEKCEHGKFLKRDFSEYRTKNARATPKEISRLDAEIADLRAELAALKAKHNIWHPASERPMENIAIVFILNGVYEQGKRIKPKYGYWGGELFELDPFERDPYSFNAWDSKNVFSWAYADDFAATLPHEGA